LAKAEETESVEVIRDEMSLQIQDNLLLKIGKPFSNTGLNLVNTIFFHSSLPGRDSLQIHLKSIALFLAINDPIPRPPLSLSLTTALHWTLQIFLILTVPDHKNLRWIEVSKRHTPFGIRKMDMKYKGREFNTLLIRQMRPAMLNILPFHEVSFFRNLSMMGFHVEILLGLDPKGIPR
jgi:hypothetical protein